MTEMRQATGPIPFSEYTKARRAARFTQWLRDSAQSQWAEMVGHRITQDMAADTLAREVLERYLIYEHSFVETAITIFGYALVKAPTISQQGKIVETLRGLTTDQLGYFDGVFQQLDISPRQRAATVLPDAVLAFRDGMLALAAHGTFEEVIAAMAAAEWMYLTWCQEAHQRQPRDPVCAQWIALHVDEPFANQVAWLLAQLDDVGPLLAPSHQHRLAAAFHRTLILEIGFHDAPYKAGGELS